MLDQFSGSGGSALSSRNGRNKESLQLFVLATVVILSLESINEVEEVPWANRPTTAVWQLRKFVASGQFVDRILSTRPITNGKEWERM